MVWMWQMSSACTAAKLKPMNTLNYQVYGDTHALTQRF